MNDYFVILIGFGDYNDVILIDIEGPYTIQEAKREWDYLSSLGIKSIITRTFIGIDGKEVN